MIKRIVKLTFKEEHIHTFNELFNQVKTKIRNFDGCSHLELWQDTNNPCIFFTYSFWESPEHLEAYRHSDLFKTTWKATKILFESKAEAWSIEVKAQLNTPEQLN